MTLGVQLTPQDTAEQALALAGRAGADGCVVLVDESAEANLRWANNTLTTNGVMHGSHATVIATIGAGEGTAAGVVTRSAVTQDSLRDLVSTAVAAARSADPAEDARPLVDATAGPGWEDEPGDTSVQAFEEFAPALGEALKRSGKENRRLYGFADMQVTTTYLASSTGVRLRHEQPFGHVSVTGKSGDLTRSAWVGTATQDFTDVEVPALEAELVRRLGWSERLFELPAGRYPTVLPPSAVADLMTYLYRTMEARSAHEGHSAFSGSGGTKVGERLSPHPVTLRSDPRYAGLEAPPFVVAHRSGGAYSVFDNGLTLTPTDWIHAGRLENLHTSRFTADLTGLAATPPVGNYLLEVDGATGTTDDLVAGLDDGLLLTCLWYIRMVDPQTLLVTGLTRDGVYRVEGGEVTGMVNNFRFNESPLDLLGRFATAGACVPSFSREWGDEFPPLTATPPLLVPNFAMDSVSQAS
jgi:predicted Zn-dependent protease